MQRSRAGRIQGFTLLELLFVLVVLGLLAGIAIPVYMGRAEAARQQKVEADFGTLATALSIYKLDNRTLPSTEQGLAALVSRPTLAPVPTRYKGGGYMRELPLDPWGNDYLYLFPSRNGDKEYDLFSHGADGKPGGEGQDADIYF